MNFTYWFSKKINLGGNSPASTKTGVIIAIVGVALALTIMMLSLAVVKGFKNAIEQKILGFDAAISVNPPYDFTTGMSQPEMHASDTLLSIIQQSIPRAKAVPEMRRHAIMKTDSDFIAIECHAFAQGHNNYFEESNIIEGRIPYETFYSGTTSADNTEQNDSIVISSLMAKQLTIGINDRVNLFFFVDGKPKMRRGHIAGIYNSNFGEYDKSVVYAPISMLQNIGQDSASYTSIAIEGLENIKIDEIEPLASKLQTDITNAYVAGKLKHMYPVDNILNKGAMYFSWLDLLDTNVIVIFILMICVAAFTLISSLFIIILDRVSTIGVLRALGATRSQISSIFVKVSMKIVGIGMVLGNIIGLGLIYLQRTYHIVPLNPEMYYLDSVPVEISWPAILYLNIGIALGTWLILILPAKLSARIDPAQTMRYE